MCGWCRVGFTPFNRRRKFCTGVCLKKRDDSRFYKKHIAHIQKTTRARAVANKDKVAAYQKTYRQTHCLRLTAQKAEWTKNNRACQTAITARYRAAQDQRTPGWLSATHLREIKGFYTRAAELTILKGIRYSVDHVVPLRGQLVSGLHVPWNLCVIPLSENTKKGNRF